MDAARSCRCPLPSSWRALIGYRDLTTNRVLFIYRDQAWQLIRILGLLVGVSHPLLVLLVLLVQQGVLIRSLIGVSHRIALTLRDVLGCLQRLDVVVVCAGRVNLLPLV